MLKLNTRLRPVAALKALLCILCLTANANAIEDAKSAIQIEADSATFDQQQGVTTYRGNVEIQQGSRRFIAETVHIYTTPNGGLDKLTAIGHPAKFSHQPAGQKSAAKAEARRIDFRAPTNQLTLSKHAKLWRNGDTLESDKITYDTASGKVESGAQTTTVGAPKNRERQRIRITLQPN